MFKFNAIVVAMLALAMLVVGCKSSAKKPVTEPTPNEKPAEQQPVAGGDENFQQVPEGSVATAPTGPVYTAPPMSNIKNVACNLTFENLTEKGAEAVNNILKTYAEEQNVKVKNSTGKTITYEVRLPDMGALYDVYKELDKLQLDKMPMEIVNAANAVNLTFRTTNITGQLYIVIKGDVAPNSKLSLGYTMEDMKEIVDPTIFDPKTGSYQAKVYLQKGKDFIYGISELGAVRKYLRIDIWTGEAIDINEEQFMFEAKLK